jgi:hypothetical protein
MAIPIYQGHAFCGSCFSIQLETGTKMEKIQEGFEVFITDGTKAVGTVRKVSPQHPKSVTIYFENAGDRSVPLEAVSDVHSEKVILDLAKLDPQTRNAIRHVHDAEDPRI